MAGSTLALLLPHLAFNIILLNLFILGPAFILYLLTLSLLYFRSKFYELAQPGTAPAFNIVLAPVGVSIMALIMTAQALAKYNFLNLAAIFWALVKIYSLVIFGYGLWLVGGLLFLYYRIIREKKNIPFSELWWAFVFPLGAFTLASFLLYQFVMPVIFIKVIYYLLYFVLLFIWLFILFKFIKKLTANN